MIARKAERASQWKRKPRRHRCAACGQLVSERLMAKLAKRRANEAAKLRLCVYCGRKVSIDRPYMTRGCLCSKCWELKGVRR